MTLTVWKGKRVMRIDTDGIALTKNKNVRVKKQHQIVGQNNDSFVWKQMALQYSL